MSNVFISYSRDDQATARRFAEGFEREGLSVWWDQTLNPGDAYDHVTEKALKEAEAVVVLWSKKSVESRWVRAEATLADRNKTLVPVMIEPCDRPIMFELTQTADLSHWNGEASDPGWRSFVDGLRRFVERSRSAQANRRHANIPGESAASGVPRGQTGFSPARKLLVAALGLLLFAGILILFFNRDSQPGAASVAESASPTVAPAKPRIAILPFGNLSPDPANAFFADGLHEEILSALSNSAPGLEVISRTTMMTYRTEPKPVAEIAKELGATYVLEGSVRRDGEDVRLTLQLIDAKTDGHIWAQNFDRKLVKAMTLQSEVAGAVASQLAVQLTPAARATAPPTRDPVAYDLYLQARLAARSLNGGSTRAEGKRVSDLYTAAIARDPDFGLAYLGRVALGPWGVSNDAEMNAWARQNIQDVASARRILGNDPRVALFEAINALGGPRTDVGKTLLLFEAAEAQGLNDPDVLILKTSALVAAERMDEALALTQRLVTLDPANVQALLAWTAYSWLAKQPEQALRAADLLIERSQPDDRQVWESYRRGLMYSFTGNNDLLAPPETVFARINPGLALSLRLRALRFQGRYAEIRQLLDKQPGPLLPAGTAFESYNFAFSAAPVAEARGWVNLLLNDRTAARADGRQVLDLVKQKPADSFSAADWQVQLRMAEGHLFSGDNAKAATAARETMTLMPRSGNALIWAYAASVAAGVLAWAGQKDEAAALLEQLADAIPGVAPATIARDPIYTVALADNARYQALKARLEAQMAATKL